MSAPIFIPGLCGLDELFWANGCDPRMVTNKTEIFNYLVNEMFTRTYKMFEYENLPETFDPICFERALQSQGFCIVKDVQDTDREKGIYALLGVGLGGERNASYLPTMAVGANPYLNITVQDKLGEGCVNVWNDSKMMGLAKLNSFYGGMVAEAFVTLRLMLVLHRSPSFISATNEDEKRDAMDYLKDLEDGKLGVIARKDSLQNFLGGVTLDTKHMTGDSHNSLKECLETVQYLMGQWNIRLGLNDNYNMKREALNSSETEANFDTLFPRIDDMLKCREKGIEEINKLYGTNIKVKLSGAWERIEKREKQDEEARQAEIDQMKQPDPEPRPEPEKEPEKEPEPEKEGEKDE